MNLSTVTLFDANGWDTRTSVMDIEPVMNGVFPVEFVVGSDHAGYEFKGKVIQRLRGQGHDVEDVGTHSDDRTDFPLFAHRVGEEISLNPDKKGVLLCGSGAGMSIVANRYPGVRAALALNASMAKQAVEHDHVNCLIMGQRIMSEEDAMDTLETFLEAEYQGGRYAERVKQIDDPPVKVLNHPLVQKKLTLLRDKNTENKKFRELVEELARLMFYEVTRTFETVDATVETPLATAPGKEIPSRILLVPIMRAGLGMVDPILELSPTAKVGHVGLYRDEETLEPVEYYFKTPTDLEDPLVTVLDPMLATGGSAAKALSLLKERGFTEHLRFLALVAAPEGIEKVHSQHPDVSIYTASIDERLDENGYILPGLGDAGDRLYGTL